MEGDLGDFKSVPEDPRAASKYLLDKLINELYPIINELRTEIQEFDRNDGDALKINEVYSLCLSQITKCYMNLFDIFRLEYSRCTILQESRHCNLERLSWCVSRLHTIHNYLEKNLLNSSENDDSANESFNVATMYFVNWIDHAFENLNKLSDIVYKTDYKETEDLYEMWKNELVECISGLHISVDELLLCAMTLCRYCLPGDQHVIKARCQVVLRETKALLSELIQGDVSPTIKATTDSLKLPVMPSNVNVTIDVLKDVLYVLETNTNTALLALLIHCFSTNTSPVEVLKKHYDNGCSCVDSDVTEDCEFVKEFDLYNERLLQIGSFAVSCSSDLNRILSLRSGLASLEALDPHLVPALMTSPDSYHSTLLIKSWRQEVKDIRDSVFLIVDPAAFADKSKQMMHQKLLDAMKEGSYDNSTVIEVISIGCVVQDFFNVYLQIEPEALTHREKLMPILGDLEKVKSECKIVSNLLSSTSDFIYDIKTPTNKTVTLDQLYKRLKLLYTLVSRINTILQPNDYDQLFDEEETKNVTHTIAKNGVTYVNSPRKNVSKSMFARTSVRSSTRNFPLSKLTKHLRVTELNFSVQLDELFNLSNERKKGQDGTFINKQLNKLRDSSVLYNFSPIKNRSSLRKVVLNRHLLGPKDNDGTMENDGNTETRESLFNDNESLQLTEVLNEINDMTSILTTPKPRKALRVNPNKTNVLTININHQNTATKNIWNIPVNTSTVQLPVDESLPNSSNVTYSNHTHSFNLTHPSNLTPPSNVTTLERITDLDFVEDKLNSLKSQMETSL